MFRRITILLKLHRIDKCSFSHHLKSSFLLQTASYELNTMDYSVKGYYFKLFSHYAEVENCHEMIFAVNYKKPKVSLMLFFIQILYYADFFY